MGEINPNIKVKPGLGRFVLFTDDFLILKENKIPWNRIDDFTSISNYNSITYTVTLDDGHKVVVENYVPGFLKSASKLDKLVMPIVNEYKKGANHLHLDPPDKTFLINTLANYLLFVNKGFNKELLIKLLKLYHIPNDAHSSYIDPVNKEYSRLSRYSSRLLTVFIIITVIAIAITIYGLVFVE